MKASQDNFCPPPSPSYIFRIEIAFINYYMYYKHFEICSNLLSFCRTCHKNFT